MAKVKVYVLTTEWQEQLVDEAELMSMEEARKTLGYSESGVFRLQPEEGQIALAIKAEDFAKRRSTKWTLRKSVADFQGRLTGKRRGLYL